MERQPFPSRRSLEDHCFERIKCCKAPCCFRLAQIIPPGNQGNQIAPAFVRSEVRPLSRAEIDLETARAAVHALRIFDDVFDADDTPAGNTEFTDVEGVAESNSTDRLKIDP